MLLTVYLGFFACVMGKADPSAVRSVGKKNQTNKKIAYETTVPSILCYGLCCLHLSWPKTVCCGLHTSSEGFWGFIPWCEPDARYDCSTAKVRGLDFKPWSSMAGCPSALLWSGLAGRSECRSLKFCLYPLFSRLGNSWMGGLKAMVMFLASWAVPLSKTM